MENTVYQQGLHQIEIKSTFTIIICLFTQCSPIIVILPCNLCGPLIMVTLSNSLYQKLYLNVAEQADRKWIVEPGCNANHIYPQCLSSISIQNYPALLPHD